MDSFCCCHYCTASFAGYSLHPFRNYFHVNTNSYKVWSGAVDCQFPAYILTWVKLELFGKKTNQGKLNLFLKTGAHLLEIHCNEAAISERLVARAGENFVKDKSQLRTRYKLFVYMWVIIHLHFICSYR
jgi:hypothetical protein